MKEFDSSKLFNSAIMDESIRQMKESLPKLIELASIRAEYNRALYDAMLNKRFTKEQAFEFIKFKGM